MRVFCLKLTSSRNFAESFAESWSTDGNFAESFAESYLLKVLLKVNAIADCFAESYCAFAIGFFFFTSSLLHTLTTNADNMG